MDEFEDDQCAYCDGDDDVDWSRVEELEQRFAAVLSIESDVDRLQAAMLLVEEIDS